jgi:hypothetical protein
MMEDTSMKKTAVLLMMFALTASLFVVDNADAHSVGQRQKNQVNRIQQGVKSDNLTAGETKGLAVQQVKLNKKKQAYWADGQLGPRERFDLHTDLNRMNRSIYRAKHNERTRN